MTHANCTGSIANGWSAYREVCFLLKLEKGANCLYMDCLLLLFLKPEQVFCSRMCRMFNLMSTCNQRLNTSESGEKKKKRFSYFFFSSPSFLVDHSRIRLQLGANDYINASLITVEEAHRNYILTQVRWRRYCKPQYIFVLDMILDIISKEAGHLATCAVKYSF